MVEGRRGRGRRRISWLDNIKSWTWLTSEGIHGFSNTARSWGKFRVTPLKWCPYVRQGHGIHGRRQQLVAKVPTLCSSYLRYSFFIPYHPRKNITYTIDAQHYDTHTRQYGSSVSNYSCRILINNQITFTVGEIYSPTNSRHTLDNGPLLFLVLISRSDHLLFSSFSHCTFNSVHKVYPPCFVSFTLYINFDNG